MSPLNVILSNSSRYMFSHQSCGYVLDVLCYEHQRKLFSPNTFSPYNLISLDADVLCTP